MNTHANRSFGLLLCGILGAGILTTSCMTSSAPVKEASTQPLLNTTWRLTRLGDAVVENPPGANAVNFLLQPSNTGLVGFSGCNRMFGQYALDGASLKFDGMGGTRMFCQARMELEQKFLGMFSEVTGWKIEGATLQLLDDTGNAIAAFSTP
jgi:heat shock protein HslJ